MDAELNQLILQYFHTAMNKAHPALLLADRSKVKILAPQFCIDRLVASFMFESDYKNSKFYGYRLEAGYENKIIIFHESAPMHNKDEYTYCEVELV
jgi:hypothetical protein